MIQPIMPKSAVNTQVIPTAPRGFSDLWATLAQLSYQIGILHGQTELIARIADQEVLHV